MNRRTAITGAGAALVAAQLNYLGTGAVIDNVFNGGPADQAGLTLRPWNQGSAKVVRVRLRTTPAELGSRFAST